MDERPLPETQAFFAARAATWDERFPADGPAYARAVAALELRRGAEVLDLGTGTGRALPPLRHHIGAKGRLVAIDITWEMLIAMRAAGRAAHGVLALADGSRLPFIDDCFDAAFAGAILHHLPGPDHGLDELARVARRGARLAIFHPIGRAALAARRGRTLSSDDLLAGANLERHLRRTGWELASLDDGVERYLAVALRV